MLHFYKITVTTLLVFSFLAVNAQHKIITLKGDVLKTTEYKVLDENEYKELMFINKKGKSKYLDYESIFSVDDKVLYEPQSNDELSLEQMTSLVNGRIEGKDAGSFWGPFIASFALTSATGFMDITNQGQMFITPLFPLGATIGVGLFGWKSKVKHEKQDEYFLTGYQEQRAFRMIKASLLGGAAGYVVAGTVYSIRHQ